MIKLRSILKEAAGESTVEVLSPGFDAVKRISHLVTDQIRDNENHFFESLDVDKFHKTFGRPKSFLGAGVFGAVYDIGSGKVLKITFDYREAPFLYKLSKNPVDGMVRVDMVKRFPFGQAEAYGIVRDDLTPITRTKHRDSAYKVLEDMKYGDREIEYDDSVEREIQSALKSMYEMDPNWRGTHVENLGIQNGDIVLYDGFSKNVKYDPSIIPSVDLSKRD